MSWSHFPALFTVSENTYSIFFIFCVALVSLPTTSVIYLHVLMFLSSMHPYRFGRLMALSKANGRVITNTGGSFLVQDCLDIIGRGGGGVVAGTMCSLPALAEVSYDVHRSVSHSLYRPLSPTCPSYTSLHPLQLVKFSLLKWQKYKYFFSSLFMG